MTVNLSATELNQRLSALVRNSVAADQFHIFGKATFWRLVGLGILAFGLGTAIGVGFYGYSYVRGDSDNLTLLSSTFSKALSEVQIRASAEGIVELEPHEIALAKGQTIAFDNNSRLFLDPEARIRADGEIAIQAPSISLPQNTSASSRVPTITNFTVFKRVPFENGVIMTGWDFLTSNQKAPSSQFCYFSENADTSGLNVVLDIARDRNMETPRTIPKGFNILAAFNRCVWFKGETP
jgi:hypothetical protein